MHTNRALEMTCAGGLLLHGWLLKMRRQSSISIRKQQIPSGPASDSALSTFTISSARAWIQTRSSLTWVQILTQRRDDDRSIGRRNSKTARQRHAFQGSLKIPIKTAAGIGGRDSLTGPSTKARSQVAETCKKASRQPLRHQANIQDNSYQKICGS